MSRPIASPSPAPSAGRLSERWTCTNGSKPLGWRVLGRVRQEIQDRLDKALAIRAHGDALITVRQREGEALREKLGVDKGRNFAQRCVGRNAPPVVHELSRLEMVGMRGRRRLLIFTTPDCSLPIKGYRISPGNEDGDPRS